MKWLSEVQNERQRNKFSSLIDIGSCNLHLSSWDLHKILKGSFKLLHDSPARREDYVNLTGSDEYPLQFCGTRWVEDKKVAEKLVDRNSIMLKYNHKLQIPPPDRHEYTYTVMTLTSNICNHVTKRYISLFYYIRNNTIS